jgi:RNA polymerase sigma-70 factor (ECF subfamily)
MSDSRSTRAFLEELNDGRDSAIGHAFERYFERLCDLAASKKGAHILDGSETIAMSVIGSFVAGIREGRFKFENSHKLWNLLVTVTLNKIRKRARSSRRERFADDLLTVLSREPNQEDLAIIDDLVEKTLSGLDAPYPRILSMRLAGATQDEIAAELKLTRSAVRFRIDRMKSRLVRLLEDSERE